MAADYLTARAGAADYMVTVSIATPVLVASAAIETWITPHVMRAVAG